MKLTNILELKYDPDNASRLPRRFEIPQIPVVENDLTVSEASETLEKLIPDLSSLNLSLDNNKLITNGLQVFSLISMFLEQELRVSLTSLSLKNQIALTANVNTLVNQTESLNKALRAKCLANPGWESKANQAINEIKQSFDVAISLSKEAVTLAELELSSAAERKEKIEKSVQPLAELLNKVGENAKNDNDLLSNYLNLAGTAARSVITTMTHAKEQPRDIQDLDILLQQVQNMYELINDVMNSGEVTEESADKISEILRNTGNELRGRNPEVLQIKMTMEAISKGAEEIKAAIKAKQSSRNTQKSPEELAESRNRLLKRLQLESRVLLFRWKVGYQEQKIREIDTN